MRKICITGVTGFLGSSLAASFLSRNWQVVALSRQDTDGARTRSAVLDAARGFQLELAPHQLEALKVVNVDFDQLDALGDEPMLQDIEEIWHSAAEMTYNPNKLDRAIKQNLNATTQLHRVLSEKTQCRRFYYISTAYTAGMNTRIAEEALHLEPTLINVYQTSKWSAEMSLAHAHQARRLPVTVFRPSIIVGHQRSGWHGKSHFGFYSFVRAVQFAQHLGSQRIKLDLEPTAQGNLVPVDVVCEQAAQLSDRKVSSTAFEVFHAVAASSLSVADFARSATKALGMRIELAEPDCPIGRTIDGKVRQNALFARRTWEFGTSRIAAAIGPEYKAFHMTEAVLDRLVHKYVGAQQTKSAFAPRNSREHLKLMAMRFRMFSHRYMRA